ncbi:MAG: MliC family protein [Pseudomonadota bacterium]|nr:MliC family protein [Pseudomonadota bacterium]
MKNNLIKNSLLSSAVVLAMTLVACSKNEPTNTSDSVANDAPVMQQDTQPSTDPAATDAVTTQVYTCTPDKTITATYDNSNAEQPKAMLDIDGVSYDLYSVAAASGARYATEQGINPEQGMQWHTKGDSAMLMTMTLDHTANPDDEQVLFDCTTEVIVAG